MVASEANAPAELDAKSLKKKLKRERQKAAKRAERGDGVEAAPVPQPQSEPEPEPERLQPRQAGQTAAVAAGHTGPEAEKKREANRKKRDRAKAKKKAEQAAAAATAKRATPIICHAERRLAGVGRGMGMFISEAVDTGESVVRARPALSVVFDHAAGRVCGLCFAAAAADQVKPCGRCLKFAVCTACAAAGLHEWHRHECGAFCNLPAGAKKGDTSTLRMLLRYKATMTHGEWCGSDQPAEVKGKEGLAMLTTLQGDTHSLPPQLLLQLSVLTGVDKSTVEDIIYWTRTNAATLDRGGKAGCALSVYMGYTNHSCEPNAQATIDGDGFVCLRAIRPIAVGEEMSISYVDLSSNYDGTCIELLHALNLHGLFVSRAVMQSGKRC